MATRWEALFKDLDVGDELTIEFMLDVNKESLPFQKNRHMNLYFNSLKDKSIKALIKDLEKTKDSYFPFTSGENVNIESLASFLSSDVETLKTLFDVKMENVLSLTTFKKKVEILLKDYISRQYK